MKAKKLGLLSTAAAFVAALSLTIASCDNNATDPADPGKGNSGRGKGGQLLDENGSTTVALNRSASEGSSVKYDFNTTETIVDNFNGGGFVTTSLSPITSWTQNMNFTIPAGSDGGIVMNAIAETELTSSIEIGGEADGLRMRPSYTGGLAPVYYVGLYVNGAEVGRLPNIPNGTPITVYPANANNPCCLVRQGSFYVSPYNGACIWQIVWDPCCFWRVFWNGQWYEFNSIRFIEGVQDGHYPYHHFNRVQVLPYNGGIEGNYVIESEFAVSY